MGVSYTREQRRQAKEKGEGLVTISWAEADGSYLTIQSPAPKKEVKKVQRFLERYIEALGK